jgi:subtilase family protein/fervidolysin-like protein
MNSSARRTARYLTLILVALATCSGATAAASGSSDARLLVKFHAGVSGEKASGLLAAVNARQMRTISALDVHVVAVSSSRAQSVLAALRKNRSVAYAEPDGFLKPQELLPNDPSFPTQFAVAGGAWGWYATHTTQAWDITRGDPSVIVAILDTGLKTQGLSDFDGQVVSGWNVMRNSTDTSTFAGNHGTYVAGVAGLAFGNGTGNAGYCPGCKVMPVQVGTDTGATWSDLAAGITWAADHGARVENMSWAGTSPSSTLANAVAYARSRGVVVTAAAGNSNCDCPTYPSATPGVIGVAGTTKTDAKDSDSNYGSWVKVAAPEANMTSWPTLNGSPGYAPVGGTSLAAPVVAAIAGLLFSANPALSGTQVEQALEASAVPVGFSVQYGRVDALGALNYLGFTDPQPASAPRNTGAPNIYVETNGDYNYSPLVAAPQAGNVLLRGQGSWDGSAPLQFTGLRWERCDAIGSGCTTVATTAKYTVQAADAGFAFRLLVTISNSFGSTTMASHLSLPVGGSAPAPTAPQNNVLPAITGTAQVGQVLTSSSGSWSGSPTVFAYQWSRCDASGAACAEVAGATSPSYSATAVDAGTTLRVAVTASNSAGSSTAVSTATAAVTAAPVVPPPPPAATQTLTLSGSLNPKNGSRTFSVNVGQGTAHAELSFSKCSSLDLNVYSGSTKIANTRGPSVVVLDHSFAAGTYIYEVTGGRCSFTLTLSVPTP